MDLRTGIIETAKALGMNPADLATIISYETAGTFDPAKAGPTTQWGQHRGLIQFGEPQAQKYGVDWNDPLGSQLGPDGAVARYFKANGWQPGMGMMDAYSIVNAGGPGRYGASDANNGGAPGTVADKVNNQMAGHREKAMALLGQTGVAAPQPGATTAAKGPLQTLWGNLTGQNTPAAMQSPDAAQKPSPLATAAAFLTPQMEPMQLPEVPRGPGYVKQYDSLSRAMDAFSKLRQTRRA